MKKRIAILMLAGIMAISMITGCGSSSESSSETSALAEEPGKKELSDIKIGLSMATLQEERWQKDRDIVIQKLIDLGISKDNILVQSADGDESKQVTQCENLITQGVDAILLYAQNGDACAPIVTSAHEAGIKVVAVDRIVNNCDLDFYVSFDCYYVGVRQAEYITKNGCDSGNWIMIAGSPTDPNATLIRNGQMSVIQPLIEEGKINVVLDQAADGWDPDKALLYTEQGLTANNNDIQCVFTSNDGCAGAAIEALKEQGLAGKIPVPGLDADLAACQRIVEGTQTLTVYRKLSIEDEIAAQAGFAFATGQKLEDVIKEEITTTNNGQKDVPAVLLRDEENMFAVDINNMEEVVKDGWLTVEQIYENIDEADWPDWTKNYR